jgi:hypothetical protein
VGRALLAGLLSLFVFAAQLVARRTRHGALGEVFRAPASGPSARDRHSF